MENTTANALARDEDFWLEDGSLVLVAKKTAFKVYKGVLAAQSPIFSDMFSSAIHPDELYDGCPVVRVSDSPQDLKWLLTYLIPKTFSHLEGQHYPKYPELSALARLGHKYEIDALERYAITRLKSAFPNDVEQWEDGFILPNCFLFPKYSSYNPIDIIDIARLTGNPSMLPLAFFLCVQQEHIIIDGLAWEDGTHLTLDKADVKRCISAVRELYRSSERAMQQTHLLAASLPCSAPEECRSALDDMLNSISQGRCIYLLQGLQHRILYFVGCGPWWQAIKQFRQDQRRELWKKLPEIFGLQDALKGHWPGY